MYSLAGLAWTKNGVPNKLQEPGFDWREHIHENSQCTMSFNTDDEGLRAERALDLFMANEVVPIAAATNAVVRDVSWISAGCLFSRS